MAGLEVCANSFTSALAAQEGGAIRVELCENMAEGGTTPSYATIRMTKERLKIAVWPIIRPRGGDFFYTDDEFELMKIDIQMSKELGCDGVVFGILKPDGKIDKDRCKTLIDIAQPMPVAFHRAFDMCDDLTEGLTDLIDLGFVRVLTSGGADNAYKGVAMLDQLVKLANNHIEIMPGAGINPDNILEIKEKTGATVFHSSARVKITGKTEHQYEQTSPILVKSMVKKLHTNS